MSYPKKEPGTEEKLFCGSQIGTPDFIRTGLVLHMHARLLTPLRIVGSSSMNIEDSIHGGMFTIALVQWPNTFWDDLPASRHAGSGTLSFEPKRSVGRIQEQRCLPVETASMEFPLTAAKTSFGFGSAAPRLIANT
jgi:hypothetical protein